MAGGQNPLEGFTKLSYTIHSHLLDKLGYTGKKREKMRDAIAHVERLGVAMKCTKSHLPITVRTLRVILNQFIAEAKLLEEKASSVEQKSKIDRLRNTARTNLQDLLRYSAEEPIRFDSTSIKIAADFHLAYMRSIMGEEDFNWFTKKAPSS